ncbi:hypothetical protein ACMT1E_13050 [Sphingomonas flavalba]|uniref:hypothetical protein n=1 Tax=Sphingomonas flavalba TaxID=2559804 RepID=UPI0039E0CC0F
MHSSTGDPFSFATDKVEEPGPYFHPLLATLITGAARLMLAITERQVADSGLEWAFCDTDSMAIAKPDAMAISDFYQRVHGIVDWFAALNPYDFDGSILKIEDENNSLETGLPEPLYCWAISAKRYALFNLAADGTPIMRKASAHGLGHLLPPYGDDHPATTIPTHHPSVLGKGIMRWHADLWWKIVSAAFAKHPDQVSRDYHPALARPAVSRYGATSPDLLLWFKPYNQAGRPYRDQVKPFGFLLAMQVRLDFGGERIVQAGSRGRPKKRKPVKPVATFDKDLAAAAASAFDRDTGEPVPESQLKSYAEALAQYHLSPESKFLNADYMDRGTTRRRHVRMTSTRHIGKESHDWERQAILGPNLDSEVEYGVSTGDLAEKLRAFIAEFGERPAAKALNISVKRLTALASDKPISGNERWASVVAARLTGARQQCTKLDRERYVALQRLREMTNRDGLRETARRSGIDPSNLRRKIRSG